ncbi:MAG: hypothetical protein OXE94_11920 [Aestuariivita sp.]|nr:hypothetical protein [Aestuariivita sp.]MCY4203139.1 hypothetical protein [Aestuariivita sp.]
MFQDREGDRHVRLYGNEAIMGLRTIAQRRYSGLLRKMIRLGLARSKDPLALFKQLSDELDHSNWGGA